MNWYLKVMKDNYVNFNGRARRKEYWMFVLVYIGIAIASGVLDSMLGMGVIGGLIALAHLLPSIAVGVRRLHDIDRSGWWLLIGLIPLIGWVIAIYWACQDGETGPNRFGADPKETD